MPTPFIPNTNYKIKPLKGGIPGITRKINEIIDALNSFMGMRTTNGNGISWSATGPIIDTGIPQIPTSGPEPWLIDPNGNAAGWAQWQVCIDGVAVSIWFWGQIYNADGTQPITPGG